MNPADETDREEDRQQGEGGGNDGAEDLARALEDGLLQAEAHCAVPFHVLRDDDGIIHDDPDGNDEGQQGHEVEGEPRQAVQQGEADRAIGIARMTEMAVFSLPRKSRTMRATTMAVMNSSWYVEATEAWMGPVGVVADLDPVARRERDGGQ